MSYDYTNLKDIEPGSTSNFYGKIVFRAKIEEQILLMLKDETGCIRVWIESPDNGVELKFELRQVVRIHRCHIRLTSKPIEGIAKIGSAGCHLVAWPPFGAVDQPAVLSSSTWTKSETDEEKIKLLSELGKNPSQKVSVEQIAERLIAHREKERTERVVEGWWNMTEVQYRQSPSLSVAELFAKPVGSVVVSNEEFVVEESYVRDSKIECFTFLYADCSECIDAGRSPDVDNKVIEECPICKKPMKQVKQGVILEVVSSELSKECMLFFSFPTNFLFKYDCGGECRSDCADRKSENYLIDLKETLSEVTIKNIEGVVFPRSVTPRSCHIFLKSCELEHLGKPITLTHLSSSEANPDCISREL